MSLLLRWALVMVTFLSAIAVKADLVYEAGHESLQHWLLAPQPPAPRSNQTTPERVELGKRLFLDPRLSGDGKMSCASCHNPMLGWSDGRKTAMGFESKVLGRATPTIVNAGYNRIQMWDGRIASLEDQAMGPLEAVEEMNSDIAAMLGYLRSEPHYQASFRAAYPGQPISEKTTAAALAAFERTIVSNNSPFDQWLAGDQSALTANQVKGFEIFVQADKGNCAVCHSAPNFTDDGFHNVGLASFGDENPDLGRYAVRPVRLMRGAFKTPTLRDITLTAPYFHDGSAETLSDVVRHYVAGGVDKSNLSPNMKALNLTADEQDQLVDFMTTLTTEYEASASVGLAPQVFISGGNK